MTVIKIQRLEWLGHVIRMNEIRSVKKTFEGKLEGRRGRGQPRLRWINDVADDLRKLSVKRWRTKALDREEWASIVRETKAKLKGKKKTLFSFLHYKWRQYKSPKTCYLSTRMCTVITLANTPVFAWHMKVRKASSVDNIYMYKLYILCKF